MKGTVIRRFRNKGIAYLTLSLLMLSFFVYRFIIDEETYPKAKSFYWAGIMPCAILTVYFIFYLMDKKPMYVFDDSGISGRGSGKLISWKELSYFESEVITRKYINIRQVTLFDQKSKKVITIDLTHSDMTIERLERILKKKLKQKAKVTDA
jgi:hypothetical protein